MKIPRKSPESPKRSKKGTGRKEAIIEAETEVVIIEEGIIVNRIPESRNNPISSIHHIHILHIFANFFETDKA